jgi:hypothetical protein
MKIIFKRQLILRTWSLPVSSGLQKNLCTPEAHFYSLVKIDFAYIQVIFIIILIKTVKKLKFITNQKINQLQLLK